MYGGRLHIKERVMKTTHGAAARKEMAAMEKSSADRKSDRKGGKEGSKADRKEDRGFGKGKKR